MSVSLRISGLFFCFYRHLKAAMLLKKLMKLKTVLLSLQKTFSGSSVVWTWCGLCLPLVALARANRWKHKKWPSKKLRMRTSRRFKASLEEGTWEDLLVGLKFRQGKLGTRQRIPITTHLVDKFIIWHGRGCSFAPDARFVSVIRNRLALAG